MPKPVVTRFAPSPTGHLHIGGARTALFCWAFARRARLDGHDGRFMIRIEDTDQARSSDESARGILADLKWLGIESDLGPYIAADGTIGEHDWDSPAGPYFQARRVAIYNAYIESLVRAGRAYPAFESGDELDARRKAAVAAKQTYRYERPAGVSPGVFNEERWDRARAGETHVVRFVSPREEVVVRDQVLGDVRTAAGELDDFVIRKADGFPTYHFAVVIDDELMGVTHVLRAQEHLANTPRHVAMQKSLVRLDNAQPFRTPVYAHMPLIFNMDGSKMGKRDKAKAARAALQQRMPGAPAVAVAAAAAELGLDPALLRGFMDKENDSLEVAAAVARAYNVALPEVEVSDFREAGYLPEAITNFLALLGWNPGLKTADGKDLEKFDLDFLAAHFSLERINRGNAKFDRKKLLSFNGDYIGALSDEAFASRFEHWLHHDRGELHAGLPAPIADALGDPARRPVLARALKPRSKTFADALRACSFLLLPDTFQHYDDGAVAKVLRADNNAGLTLLAAFKPRLEGISAGDWTPDALHAAIEAFVKERSLPNPGPIAQPLRVALTGTAVSPGLGETMALLGRESTLARVEKCLARFG